MSKAFCNVVEVNPKSAGYFLNEKIKKINMFALK